jgi:hypothetical protein
VFNETSVLEARLNRNHYTAIPGIVTGFGLLCTFVAILIALLDVKLVDKQFTGLDKLVSGLSGKFLSSIAALFSATVFMLCEKGLPTICQPPFVTFLPPLHDRLTTNPARIIARTMTQHGHQDTQQSVANIA